MNQGLKATKKSKDEPQFVSFSVLAKHGSKETAADNHLDMHISVYTVRSLNGVKDCIYYDPSVARMLWTSQSQMR